MLNCFETSGAGLIEWKPVRSGASYLQKMHFACLFIEFSCPGVLSFA